MTLLTVRNLRKSFGGIHAVEDVSFALAAGQLLAMIGPNGAGKTTCFNMLNGQLRPDGGSVLLEGRDITGLRPRRIWRLGVGRTFQITRIFASMTVRENVQMALIGHRHRVRSLWRPAAPLYSEEAERLLRQVGLDEEWDRACSELAYGDLKRVDLAMALASEPRLLLMDEPTAGMAPQERTGLMTLTTSIARDHGIAVLFTEHDMDIVFGHADRVIVLNRGRVIAQGTPREVRATPEVQEVYLGSGAMFGRT